jgi:hypothetical protein
LALWVFQQAMAYCERSEHTLCTKRVAPGTMVTRVRVDRFRLAPPKGKSVATAIEEQANQVVGGRHPPHTEGNM